MPVPISLLVLVATRVRVDGIYGENPFRRPGRWGRGQLIAVVQRRLARRAAAAGRGLVRPVGVLGPIASRSLSSPRVGRATSAGMEVITMTFGPKTTSPVFLVSILSDVVGRLA